MKRWLPYLLAMLLIPAITESADAGVEKERIVYAVVLTNQTYVVGAPNPETGLFRSYDNGETWEHSGWKNVRAFGVTVPQTDEGKTIYLAAGNGVHKTENDGAFWRLQTDWQVTEVLDISLHPDEPEVVYIATAYGPFKSPDAGRTWSKIGQGMDQYYCTAILIDSGNKERLFIGGEDGLYRSVDSGASWIRHALEGTGVRTIVQHPIDHRTMYLGTEDRGIYRSRDGGDSWEPVNRGLTLQPIYTLALDPDNPAILYAGGWKTGLLASTNGGNSWTQTRGELAGESIVSLAVHPDSPEIVFAGAYHRGLYRSDTGGRTWRHVGLNRADVWRIIIQ